MSKRKDQRKVRLVDGGVLDAERTLKVINDLKHEKLRLTYKQGSAANTEKHSARGMQSSWSGPASSFDRVDLEPADSSNGDHRSGPPSQFSILHSDRAEVPRAHWVDQEIPSRDLDRCDSVDSAKTFTVPRPAVTAPRRRPDADADGLPSTPTFKFVDAPMPVVPPTPANARQILTMFPKDPTASWVAVESPDAPARASAWPATTPLDIAPCDLTRPNGVAPLALRLDGVEQAVNGSTQPPRPTIIRKSMKFVDWDQVEEPLAPIQAARLDRWDGATKPMQKRKSMKFVEPPEVHQDASVGKGEESTLHAPGQAGRPNVVRKTSVVDPATVLASYPGFCDVRDLDKKRRPKVHLDVIQSQRTKPDAPIRGANLNNQLAKAESEFAPRKKSTITPSTWREERKKLNAKVHKEKVPVNSEQPNENRMKTGEQETEPNENSPSHTNPQTNSPSTTKEEEVPKPIKRFKPRVPKVEEREPREKSPPKVKRYDVEETREFIERQKQLRLAKLAKEKDNKQALKETIAMKLKALQEKQLQLVRANVEARLAKKSALRRPGGQRRSGPEASAKMASPRRHASTPLRPPAVGLTSPKRRSDRDIDRLVQTFTDNLNQDQLNSEQVPQSPRQGIVISNSPPEKLEKPKSTRSSPAAPHSRSETDRISNEAQRNVDAQFPSKHSNIVDEFYSEMRKMDSNTEELRSGDLASQLASACNDLSHSLAAKSAVRGASPRRADGSTVHQHRNITARSTRTQNKAQGELSSVLDYDRKRKRNQAATKIQATFRGYRVRKTKENSAKIRKHYEFFNDPDRSFDSDISEGPLSDSGTNNEENLKQANGFEFDLRVYHLQPQPNNFISAVKQKLKMHQNARNNCWMSPPRQKVPNSQVINMPVDVKKSNSKEAIIPTNEILKIIPADKPSRTIPPPQKSTYSQDFDDTFASSIISMVNGSSSTHSKASIIPSYVNDLKTGNSESTKNLIIPNVGLVRKRANDDSTPRTISENISVSTSRGASGKRSEHSVQTPSRHSPERSKTERNSLGVSSSENLSSVQEILSSSGNERDDDDDDDSHSLHRQREQRLPEIGSQASVPVGSSRLNEHRQNVHANLNNGRLYPADALHMQFQAELNLLDSVDESRRQLLEVEKLRAVNLAQQGASSLAHALKVAQQKHEEHLGAVERKQAFEEALQRERLELQNFFKDALKSQTLLRKSSSESLKITASAHSSNDAGKSSIPEVLESDRDSGEEIEMSLHGSSINASMSENIEGESSRTESVSDLELSSLDITRKMKLHLPHLGTSVNAASDLAAVDRTAQNGDASMAKFSFHLLEQLVRDEELRVQHQMSLLKLQDKTLTEKTKAEMAWLEVKKRQLRGKGMENQMSAIKKKQRGLILKLQQDKEELARLKETQRIASDERKIMLRSQQHALRMDLAAQNAFHRTNPLTNDKHVLATPPNHSKTPSEIVSEHRSRSNEGKSKDTTLVETDLQQSDVPEEISLKESQSDMTVSTQSPEQSTDTKVDVQYLEQLVLDGLKKLDKNKRFLNDQAKELQLRREAVEKSLAQRKRLADEERKVQELEAQESAMALTNNVVQKQIRSFRDTSTSPFQTIEKQDSKSTISEHIANSEASTVQSAINLDGKSSSSHPVTMVDKSTSASVATDNYIDESFESAVSSEANSNATALNQETQSKSSLVKRSSSERMPSPVLSIKASLSPLMTNKARRRYSSGSDDSIIYSQTETTSEQSDAEGRITALNEQLKRRMLEAERLRREQKRLNRERLSCKEQTLLKQIQEYDKIIARAKQDIELEHDNHQSVSIVRPKIKQPRVAEKKQSNDAGHSSGSQHVPLDHSLRKVRVEVNETEHVNRKIPIESVITEALSTATEGDSLPSTTDEQKVEPEISDKSSNSAISVSEHIDDVSDGNISETESRKSLSEDTSAETTIHSLVPSLKSDAQDKKEDSKESTLEETPRSQEDEENKVKVSRDTLEQSGVEDDVISAASSADSADTSQGLLEDLEENSGSHTSGVIKIFLDEKVPAITTPVVEEIDSTVFEVTGINDTGISEGPLEDEFLVQEQEIELDSLDGPALLNETFVVERQTADVSAQLKALTVDRLTDSILRQLLVECTTPPQKRTKVASELPSEKQNNNLQEVRQDQEVDENEREPVRSVGVADLLLDECLRECTTHMVALHKKRVRRNASPSSVRRRVHEIMAETASPAHRSAKRPQDLMISTYDVLSGEEESPPDTPACLSSDNSFDNDYLDDPAKSPAKRAKTKVDLGVALSPPGESGSADTDGFTQEWFDEDFGLGTTHTKREAAELRIQQLQIEQEIQQLQQAQEQIPYFYIREIPNKPPPPYTPPGQSPPRPGSRTSPESRRRQSRNVTASQEETVSLAATATDYLYAAVTEGADLDLFQPPDTYYESSTGDSRNTFKKFMFDLVKEIVKDAYDWEAKTWQPSWETPLPSNKRQKLKPRTKEMLQDTVQRKTLLYLGFVQRSGKENMIMSWGRKKRDFVDELLMQEAHEEEESWINYDEDETNLKNDITLAILQSLIDESAQVFRNIRDRRLKKQSSLS